ncbi:MAG: 7TM-DISM domain-containing protein, partial [Pseudomonadota bacterium]
MQQVQAQQIHTHNGYSIVLTDDNTVYPVFPKSYILEDPSKQITFETLIARLQGSLNGNRKTNQTYNFGLSGDRQWIAFKIQNRSNHTGWLLDFGDHTNGKAGIIDELYVYDHNQKEVLYDFAQRERTASYNTAYQSGTKLLLNIQKNQELFLITYLSGFEGQPLTSSLQLISKEEYLDRTNAVPIFSLDNIILLSLIAVILVLIG